jgi:hypothetical protein
LRCILLLNKLLYILPLLLFSTGKLCSQQLTTDIKFTTYTRANGLPEEHINNVNKTAGAFYGLAVPRDCFALMAKISKPGMPTVPTALHLTETPYPLPANTKKDLCCFPHQLFGK